MNVVILVFFLENKEALEMFMSHVEDWKSDTKVMWEAVSVSLVTYRHKSCNLMHMLLVY